MKYSKEDKIEWVKQYLSDISLRYPPGVKKNSFRFLIRKLAKKYQMHGEETLEHRKRRHFTVEQMLQAINACKETSYSEVGLRLEIESCVLLNWARTYSEKSLNGLKLLAEYHGRPKMKKDITPSQKTIANETQEEKIARLERELLEARTEIALLKKVKALTEGKKEKNQGR